MIRTAVMKDLESVYSLLCGMEQKFFDKNAFENIFNSQLKADTMLSLIFEQKNEVLGVLNLRMEYQLHHCAKIAEIMELSVKKGYRSKGIGRALLAVACQRAKDNDCIQIEVCCNKLRIEAHRFYEREGMHNFHYKFSMNLDGQVVTENKLGL